MSGRAGDPDRTSSGQFRKGCSGNPGGRPAKAAGSGVSAFDIVVSRTLSVTRKGVAREVTMEEALQHRTYQDAIAGKKLAQREVLRWIARHEAWLAEQDRKHGRFVYEALWEQDSDSADEAMLLLGIVSQEQAQGAFPADGRRVLLEPWAVQAALDRRRGRPPLEPDAVAEIERRTRDGKALRWPGRARS
jgi:hypothetical protein